MNLSPFILMIICSMMAFAVTTLGSATVLFLKKLNDKLMALLMGFGAGVMIASSIWSLLIPAIDRLQGNFFISIVLAFLIGGFIIMLGDRILLKKKSPAHTSTSQSLSRSIILIFAITLHNIPEGMCIGVAFGAGQLNAAAISGAIALSIGIAMQNFPEGAAVSMPLHVNGFKKSKSFFLGSMSGIVEPVFAILGYFLAILVGNILSFLLALAAGAMITTAARELIPESTALSKKFSTIGLLLGFVVMMTMDNLL